MKEYKDFVPDITKIQKCKINKIKTPYNFYSYEYLNEKGIKIDKVINLHVPDEEIMVRAINRRTCENLECKEIYHMIYNPPKVEGICDKCGSKLFIRKDDNEETVSNRLHVYHEQTEPLIKYYTEEGILSTVVGQEKFEDTVALVKEALK